MANVAHVGPEVRLVWEPLVSRTSQTRIPKIVHLPKCNSLCFSLTVLFQVCLTTEHGNTVWINNKHWEILINSLFPHGNCSFYDNNKMRWVLGQKYLQRYWQSFERKKKFGNNHHYYNYTTEALPSALQNTDEKSHPQCLQSLYTQALKSHKLSKGPSALSKPPPKN